MGFAYPKLFEPLNIGNVTIKNRIAMAPMGMTGLVNPDGSLTQRAVDYYIERARGGVGLIITGLFKVENDIETIVPSEPMSYPSRVPLVEICEAVHSLGTKVFVQLTAGFGRVIVPHRLLRGQAPVSASASPNYWYPDITCRPLKTDEVEKIVAAFGRTVEILVSLGVDGVELHGHEGYLFDQFTTPIWNKRTDKYGGDLKARLTFPVEVLREIKKCAGASFPVQYRFGLKHYIKGLRSGALDGERFVEAGRDIPEGLEMAKLLEEAGFDALHVDAGCYDSFYWPHPPTYQEHGCMADLAARTKTVVKIPIIAVGKLDIPEMAEKVVSENKTDMVALGRALLADPYWPVKTSEGRTNEIRPCIGCHDGCIGRFRLGKQLCCAVNPACGRERLYRLNRAEKSKKVMVIGGGVSGMEAARVAAIRGHSVTVYEKGESLGGHLIEASVPGFKKDLRRLLAWYKNQINKLEIKVVFQTVVSSGLISREKPDVIIIATGSKPNIPGLPGIKRNNVVTCIDLLLGHKKTGDTVVVIGGGLVGCETSLWLAQKGKKVTIMEMLPELMVSRPPVPHANKTMMLDLLSKSKVKILTETGAREITETGIVVSSKSNGTRNIKADTVVLAVGLKPDDTLYKALLGKCVHLFKIGDSLEPRNIMGAVWDGYELGRTI